MNDPKGYSKGVITPYPVDEEDLSKIRGMIKPKTWNDACREILDELGSLLCRKQHDYGHGNILAFGELGVLVRMSDKFERLKNLYKQGVAPKNESEEDTIFDIAGYAVIDLMLKRGLFELQLDGSGYATAEEIKETAYQEGLEAPRRPIGA